MAGDDGSYGRLGDCCLADGIQPDLYIDEYVRARTDMTIYGHVALLDIIQSSFSISTFNMRTHSPSYVDILLDGA